MNRPHLQVVAGAALALVFLASCEATVEAPRPGAALAPEVLEGSWVGTVARDGGIERAVLEVEWVRPVTGRFRFAYRLHYATTDETGVGDLRPDGDGRLRICFSESACGWLSSDDGEPRIESSNVKDGEPAWRFRGSH